MPWEGMDQTRSDGSGFQTTRWTQVLSARERHGVEAEAALAGLCERYWEPLYVFLLRGGHPPEEAQDLVQGYFERLIAQDFLRGVERSRGRFRSFLMASLTHHVANVRRTAVTQKRGGRLPILPFDDPAVRARCESEVLAGRTPESSFDHAWARAVMERALDRLRAEYRDSGREEQHARLSRWLTREAVPGEYAGLAGGWGTTEGALAAGVLRLRRRFREMLREVVGETVQESSSVDEEMRYLLRVLME